MDSDNIFRRLRGAVGNAVVWGLGWTTLGLVVAAAGKVAGVFPLSWLDTIGVAVRFGIVGGIAGGAFSLAIGLLYRGRRVSELSPVRFGIGGGIVAGVFVPAFLQAMNLLSGGGMIAMKYVLDDGLWSALFGAVAAGGSVLLAQRARTRLPVASQDPPGRLQAGNPLASTGERDARRENAPAWRSAED
jgi:hypothetical protein